eukprot:3242387-Pyramimonas_sp.AAC.1
MGIIRCLEVSIALNSAGGSSRALGPVRVARVEALVMPETPAVLSVGERCASDPTYFCPTVTERTWSLRARYLTCPYLAEGRWVSGCSRLPPGSL